MAAPADATRQSVIEMFLGLQMGVHFPSVQLLYTDTSLPLSDESEAEDAPDEPALPDSLKVGSPPTHILNSSKRPIRSVSSLVSRHEGSQQDVVAP